MEEGDSSAAHQQRAIRSFTDEGYACISMDQLSIYPVNEVLQEWLQLLLKQSPLTPAGVAEGGGGGLGGAGGEGSAPLTLSVSE